MRSCVRSDVLGIKNKRRRLRASESRRRSHLFILSSHYFYGVLLSREKRRETHSRVFCVCLFVEECARFRGKIKNLSSFSSESVFFVEEAVRAVAKLVRLMSILLLLLLLLSNTVQLVTLINNKLCENRIHEILNILSSSKRRALLERFTHITHNTHTLHTLCCATTV